MRVVILLAVFLGAPAFAQTYKSDEHSFRVVQVVKGLEQPWSLAFLPDGRMLATEKAGRLRMIANGRLEPQPIAGLPRVTVHGQGDCTTSSCILNSNKTGLCTSRTPPGEKMGSVRNSPGGVSPDRKSTRLNSS